MGLAMKKRARIVEQLISLRTWNGVTLHAYVICPVEEVEISETVSDRLCSLATERGLDYMPVLLVTKLSTGGEIVREVMRRIEGCEEALALAQTVLDGKEQHHLTIFGCVTDGVEDRDLMHLH
jgi:hypothetical protein